MFLLVLIGFSSTHLYISRDIFVCLAWGRFSMNHLDITSQASRDVFVGFDWF